ncbi:GtrA family protein [Saccharomonospora amisosensis]|uniref:GtrA family protein n=1 Tax=Saccharomonospora amisosensis TaxID=1128677 RepID=UPI0014226971|nr:GtrA family protein [Saccharomonospora amisosensis]
MAECTIAGVSTATAAAPPPGQPSASRPRLLVRLFRAATSSIVATSISQVTLIGLLWWGATPSLASAVAFVAGAIPNYFLARSWAWGRKGKPQVARELMPYFAVIGAAGLASVGLTTVAGWITEPLRISGFVRIIVLDAAFLASYSLVFILKFALLDRLVFAGGARTRAATSRS